MIPYHLLDPNLSDEEFMKGVNEHRKWMARMQLHVIIAASIGGLVLLAVFIFI